MILPIDSTEIDFIAEQVKRLEKNKEGELAKHHMTMKGFQDQIDNLLAIEYKPEVQK